MNKDAIQMNFTELKTNSNGLVGYELTKLLGDTDTNSTMHEGIS